MKQFLLALPALLLLAACGQPDAPAPAGGEAVGSASTRLEGKVRLDGSSTVFPISEAVAEEYGAVEPRVRVTVGVSGTGGGFKKFINGETDINDASRPIKSSEMDKAVAAGIKMIELPVAFDGLSVIVNQKNDWVDHLTIAELNKIWQPDSVVTTWKDVRPEWPDRPIRLYGPGTDSGTFDYFTKAVNGKEQASRPDFTASEDDNVLVQGISGDLDSLGYFGFAYYKENRDKLKIVPIDGGTGPIAPTEETINNSTYAPLSRPVFIYVNASALDKPQVASYVDFYLKNAGKLSSEVGYIPLPQSVYTAAAARVAAREHGTAYHGDNRVSDLVSD